MVKSMLVPKIESSMSLFTENGKNPAKSICKMFSGNFLPKSGRIGFILLIIQGWKDLKQASVTSSHGMSMATSRTFIDADVSIFFANLTGAVWLGELTRLQTYVNIAFFGYTLGWLVVSKIFHFHPYLGKISILTNIFQRGWNHQLVGLET